MDDSAGVSCFVCGEVFDDQKILTSHMREEHPSQMHVCPIDGRRFKDVGFLEMHMKSSHRWCIINSESDSEPRDSSSGVGSGSGGSGVGEKNTKTPKTSPDSKTGKRIRWVAVEAEHWMFDFENVDDWCVVNAKAEAKQQGGRPPPSDMPTRNSYAQTSEGPGVTPSLPNGLPSDLPNGDNTRVLSVTNGDITLHPPAYTGGTKLLVRRNENNGDVVTLRHPKDVDTPLSSAGNSACSTPDSGVPEGEVNASMHEVKARIAAMSKELMKLRRSYHASKK